MTTVDLVKRIEALPEAEKLAVARFVDSLTARLNSSPETPEHLYERIVGRAERIFALHGPLGDSTADIRELRDSGHQPLLYVPDASVAIKWFLREEHSENSRVLLSRILGQLDRAVAPDLLRLEIAHVLRKKTHSGLDIAEALEAWKDLNAVPIEWAPVQPLLDAILIEALARKISVYDMTYLDVARRHRAVVVTADDGLAANGARENLAIHVRDYHPQINALYRPAGARTRTPARTRPERWFPESSLTVPHAEYEHATRVRARHFPRTTPRPLVSVTAVATLRA